MKTFEITKDQFSRAVEQFRAITQENSKVEFKAGNFWVLGTELEILRLAVKYNSREHGFSSNLGSFYFRLESPSFTGTMATEEN